MKIIKLLTLSLFILLAFNTSDAMAANAQCGTANGRSFDNWSNITGYCRVGSVDSKSLGTAGNFIWRCNSSTGTNAWCSAIRNIKPSANGQCKVYSSTYISQPATSTSAGCNLGNYKDISDTNEVYRWQCVGINEGITATCSADKAMRTEYGQCGTAQGSQFSHHSPGDDNTVVLERPDIADTRGIYCAIGSITNKNTLGNTHSWQCLGSNGGSTASCSANKGDVETHQDLKILSIEPQNLKSGDHMIIRFNDILADYYMISASCKEGLVLNGKARPNLCVEGEKIYPTGKDVVRVENFYPSSNSDSSFYIEISAFKNEKLIGQDLKLVEIMGAVSRDEELYSKAKIFGDIKFLNPKEGQRKPEKIEAGQIYTLKWENIAYAEWTDVHLYRYDRKPSNDYLRNGPSNVSVGIEILDLGTAYSNQESLQVDLSENLKPGYYYFKFGGKAAGDSSPAIEIVSRDYGEDNDFEVSASITRISNNGHFINGKAYNTEKIGVGIITKDGKDVDVRYVDVNDGYWSYKLPKDLFIGSYEAYLYLDNVEYDRKSFEINEDDEESDENKNEGGMKVSKEEALTLVANLFGRESSAYQIISLLITLGIIK